MEKIYGYDINNKGKFIINENESEIVKTIFKLYIQGFSFVKIANKLSEQNAPLPQGRFKWHKEIVSEILREESYIGTKIITEKIIDNHKPIINDDLFIKTQEMLRRKAGYSLNFNKS